MAKVGFIGLGIMGVPMACHLMDAGHDLSLFSLPSVPVELTNRGKACASSKINSRPSVRWAHSSWVRRPARKPG